MNNACMSLRATLVVDHKLLLSDSYMHVHVRARSEIGCIIMCSQSENEIIPTCWEGG